MESTVIFFVVHLLLLGACWKVADVQLNHPRDYVSSPLRLACYVWFTAISLIVATAVIDLGTGLHLSVAAVTILAIDLALTAVVLVDRFVRRPKITR